MKTTREILFEAAERIRLFGLSKHAFHTSDGRSCMMGAIDEAADDWRSHHEAKGRCEAALKSLGYRFASVFSWNDHPQRTAEHVAAVLEYAASVEA